MAPKTVGSAGQHARNKLVEPVLPALPFLTRNKRHTGRIVGGGVASLNDNANSPRSSVSKISEEDGTKVKQLNGDGIEHKDSPSNFGPGLGKSDSLSGTRSPSVVLSELQDSSPSNVQPSSVPFLPESDASTAQSDRSVTEPSVQAASSTAHSTPAHVHRETVKGQAREPEQVDTQATSRPVDTPFGEDVGLAPSLDITSTRARAASSEKEEDAFLQPTTNLGLGVGDSSLLPPAHSMLKENGNKQKNYVETWSNGNMQPNNHSFHSGRYPELSSRANTQLTILDHMLHLVNSKQYADWTLQINQPNSTLAPFVSYAHGVVLLRSETLRQIMSDLYSPTVPTTLLSLFPARNIQPHAFEAALRFLYADTMLSTEDLFPRNTFLDKHARYHAVDYVLSYWVSAIELGIEPVKVRAFDILAAIIEWDIIELLVREAGTLRAFTSTDRQRRMPSENMLAANSIMGLVFNFLLRRTSVPQFKLDTASQPTAMSSRLDQFEFGSTSSNPALANMVFGSMPTSSALSSTFSAEEQSSSTDTVVSNILLNLDHHDLDHFTRTLVGMHGLDGIRILTDVVEEREKRRLHIFHNRSINNKHRPRNPAMWDIIGWREYVEDGQLRREQVVSADASGNREKPHMGEYFHG